METITDYWTKYMSIRKKILFTPKEREELHELRDKILDIIKLQKNES